MKHTLSSWLKYLEERNIITQKPHPIIPFALAALIYALTYVPRAPDWLNLTLIILAPLTLLFALLHLIVVIILKNAQ